MQFQELLQKANNQLFIIGEAGVNHNGDLETAKKLVDVAKQAGCDAVKFQTWITEKVYSKQHSIKPDYQLRTTDVKESEFDTIKNLELSFDAFHALKNYCDQQKILFLSTPDEATSADFLINIGTPIIKIASQDVGNLPFLRYLAQKKVPLILSTGASTLTEVVESAETILKETNELILLHCLSAYPAPMDELNLLTISTYKQMFNCLIGFSDHTIGHEAACAALALGARVFEKHFTLDTNQEGPDHQASLDPDELVNYIKVLRLVYRALGDGYKRIMPSEASNRIAFRRYLVSARAIRAGDILSEDDFNFKKVVNGIAPKYLDNIIGSKAKMDIVEDTILSWAHLEMNV